jgi:hypothetical protein
MPYPAVQPMAVPGGYVARPPLPVGLGTLPEAPAKSGGKMWTWIVIAAVVAGGYFYEKSIQAPATAPATAPAQPGGTAPQGAPAQPGGTAPGVPAPGTPAQPATTGPLVQQQAFAGHWRAIYGKVELTNTSWTNNSNTAMQSATLECDQYAANGSDLSQAQMTLTGPVQPGGKVTFNPIQMGSVSNLMTKVNCWISAVTPAN